MMKPKKRKVVTIMEIARKAGVSPASVSSVLSNRHVERRISQATVQRVREAVRELGYIPNMAGRRLRTLETDIQQIDIAIFTSFQAPLALVEQAVRELQMTVDSVNDETTRYTISIEMFHAGKLSEKPGILDANRYHGVIFSNTLPPDDEFLEASEFPYSSVILGRRIPGKCCVLEQPKIVGARAAEIMIEAGSRAPAVLFGEMLTQATQSRVSAFEEVVKERLGKDPIHLVSKGLQPRDGVDVMSEFLAGKAECDGIFSVTDSLAIGAYKAISAANLSIPEDILFVGVGDHEDAEFLDPPMTTVADSNEAMVKKVIPLLFAQLNGAEESASGELITPPVCLRRSTTRA